MLFWGTSSGNYGDDSGDIENSQTYTVAGLSEGTTYFFAVKAYDDQGRESEYSNEVATLAILSPQDGFYVNSSNYTSYTISGIAEAFASVEIFTYAISLGTTTAKTDGTWTIDVAFTPVDEGVISLTAESNSITSPAVTGTFDKTSPDLITDLSSPSHTTERTMGSHLK